MHKSNKAVSEQLHFAHYYDFFNSLMLPGLLCFAFCCWLELEVEVGPCQAFVCFLKKKFACKEGSPLFHSPSNTSERSIFFFHSVQ